MPMQKLVNKRVRKIAKLGGRSLGISLPIEYMAELKWKVGQKVVVQRHGRHLIVKDWKA